MVKIETKEAIAGEVSYYASLVFTKTQRPSILADPTYTLLIIRWALPELLNPILKTEGTL